MLQQEPLTKRGYRGRQAHLAITSVGRERDAHEDRDWREDRCTSTLNRTLILYSTAPSVTLDCMYDVLNFAHGL